MIVLLGDGGGHPAPKCAADMRHFDYADKVDNSEWLVQDSEQ
jgi:hypothetical protein